MQNHKNDLLTIHIAVMLFGLAGLFGKLLHVSPLMIVFGRVFFASLVILLFIVIKNQSIKLHSRSHYMYMVVLGVLLALHWVTFFKAIQVSTVAVGLLSFSTFPIFTTILDIWFFKQKFSVMNLLITLAAFAGVALIIPVYEFGTSTMSGVLYGVASGASFAVLTVLNRVYVSNYSSMVIVFYQDVIATLVLVPFVMRSIPAVTMHDVVLLCILGTVFTALAHTLFIKGLATVRVYTAGIITCLEAVYGIVCATVFLHEQLTLRIVLAGVLIIGTSFFVTLRSKAALVR